MSNNSLLEFDIQGIKECQQNRHPLLFIDHVFDVIPGSTASAIKCFSYNEWFFPAHFEDEPNVPGFILVESLVQTFIMTFLTIEKYKGKKTSFLDINNVKFRQKVIPGQSMKIKANLESFKRGVAKGNAEAFINDTFICSASFVIGIPDEMMTFIPSK